MGDTATVTITGTLKTSGGTAIANEQITFADTNGDTIAPATTGSDGSYSTKATVSAPAVEEVFTAAFAGDTAKGFNASSGTATVTLGVNTTITVNITVG